MPIFNFNFWYVLNMKFNESDNYSAPACARGFWVLQCLNTARKPLTLEQLFQVSGVPKATLSRILETLLQMEILYRNKDKTYEPRRQLTAIHDEDIVSFENSLKVEMTSLSKKCGYTVEWYEYSKSGMVLQQSVSPVQERRVWAKEGYIRNWLGEVDAVYIVGKAFSESSLVENETSWRYGPKGVRNVISHQEEAIKVSLAKEKGYYIDLMFNENGVRRSAVALSYHDRVRGVLAIAECWTPSINVEESDAVSHLKTIRQKFTS